MYRRKLGAGKAIYKKDVLKLINAKNLDQYRNLKCEISEEWVADFAQYFEEYVNDDLEKNFRQSNTNKFSIFDSTAITSNLSESFHLSFKRIFNKKFLNQIEQVVFSTFIRRAKGSIRQFHHQSRIRLLV